jgi:hypothetical protein
MKRLILIAGLSALAGCASDIMKGFVGQPIQTVMLRYGPPAGAFDMPDGTRAFQWAMTRSGMLPTNVQQSGSVVMVGQNAYWMSNAQITGGQTITSECLYTMTGRWDEATKTWMVTGFQKPGFTCE